MPELPEVERVRRTMEAALGGQRLVDVEIVPDEIVLKGVSEDDVAAQLRGRVVSKVGRKGKYWWLEFEDGGPVFYGHLGMAGWIRELGAETIRLREHGEAPLEDENGRPRFLKMMLTGESGRTIAFTDGRRLARMWLGGPPETDKKLLEMGRDTWLDPWTPTELAQALAGRTAPIKALLLDQKLFCGVGNWIADEVLYHARISPKRLGGDLKKAELKRLCDALVGVIDLAVEVGADASKYPENWLFNTRWGGAKGGETHEGRPLVRESVGGRTTAWVPSIQK